MRSLMRFVVYLRDYWWLVAGAYAALLLHTAAMAVTPQFIRFIVDRGFTPGGSDFLSRAVLGLLGVTVIRGVATFFMSSLAESASQGVAFKVRDAIYRKLCSLSPAYHDGSDSGQLLQRAVQDVERIRFMSGRATLRVVDGVVLGLGTLVFLALMNPLLAALAIVTMPLLAHRALVFARQERPLFARLQQQLGRVTARLEQNLRGIRVVKSFTQEPRQTQRFDNEVDGWFDLSAQNARLVSLNGPLLDLIANLGLVIVMLFGGVFAIRGNLTLGELVAFTSYMGQLVGPVRRIGRVLPGFAMASASAERILEVLDAESEVSEAPDAITLESVRGHVRFEGVGFGYGGPRPVLDGVNLDVQPGQTLAVLGETGSGKSTLINLLIRWYDPEAGRIFLDGHDLRSISLASLRASIGVVLQESVLFATSIRENITFGRPEASPDQIEAAARAAEAHDFITRLPQGYDTVVGERGMTLSGGQKQRIAIARAIIRDPPVLVLDDATSSVDTGTEQLIQQALATLMAGRTSLVVAQRLSTIRLANLVVILQKGRVAASGSHEQLLESSDLYREINRRQLKALDEPVAGVSPAADEREAVR